VDDGDGPVGTVDGPQQGQGDGVVSAERDDSWEGLALDGRTPFVCICRRGAREDPEMAFLDLLESPCVVVSVWRSVPVCLCESYGLNASLTR
jgi:hypothetical protein